MTAGSEDAASGSETMSSERKGICSSAERVAAKSVAARSTATDNRRHFIVSAVVPLTLTLTTSEDVPRKGADVSNNASVRIEIHFPF